MASRINQSQFALLGLLSLGPMSGYDLRQLIHWSVGHFWNEGYGQIYPTLNRLASDGLLERRTERTHGKPDRHVYSLTAAGLERLRDWLREAPRSEVPRNELLLKLFFGGLQPPSFSREHVLEHRERHLQLLRAFGEIRGRIAAGPENKDQQPFWLMTLSYGEHISRAKIAWCDETLATLGAMKSELPEATRPSSIATEARS